LPKLDRFFVRHVVLIHILAPPPVRLAVRRAEVAPMQVEDHILVERIAVGVIAVGIVDDLKVFPVPVV
jgi:hypothetical protein